MSISAMAWAWEQECRSGGEKLVLLALADHASDEGHCYPGLRLIALKTGLGERQVRRYIRLLEQRGIVAREKRFRDRTQTSNKYRLLLPEKYTRSSTTGGAALDDRGRRSSTTGRPGHLRPPNESSVEPSVEPQETRPREKQRALPVEAVRLSTLLADHVESVHPNHRELLAERRGRTVEAWAETLRLMHARDGRAWAEIKQAIRGLSEDVRAVTGPDQFPGWGVVIQSAKSLREKFDKLRRPNVDGASAMQARDGGALFGPARILNG